MFPRNCGRKTATCTPTHSSKAEEMLAGTGCAPIYELFELCLADNDRSFAKCNAQMMKCRQCMQDFSLAHDKKTKERVANGEQTTTTW